MTTTQPHPTIVGLKTPVRMELLGRDLSVDPELQRRLDHGRANDIGTHFEPALLGTLAISLREDGFYYIVDGQHRREGARVAGFDGPFVCDVYEGLTRQEEAQLFLGLNNTRRPAPIDLFRLAVEAKDPKAVHITAIAAKYGWKIGYPSGRSGSISAPSALIEVYNLDGTGVILEDVLIIATKAWGLDNTSTDSRILRGLGALIHRYNGAVDKAALTERLSRSPGANHLVGQARAMAQLRRVRINQAMAEVIVDLYNQFRRNALLPAWH